jgi:hypothetical protein
MQIQPIQAPLSGGPGQMLSALVSRAGGVGASRPAGAPTAQGGAGGTSPVGGPQGQKGAPQGPAGGQLASGTMSGLLGVQEVRAGKRGDSADPVSKFMQVADTYRNGGISADELKSVLGDDSSGGIARTDRDPGESLFARLRGRNHHW